MIARSFTWWHAAGLFLIANLISALPAGYAGDSVFYNSFARPALAPPDWAFAPAWLMLNITSLIALHRIANGPHGQGRTGFIASEALGWALFASFTTLYFLLQSPMLGAINTALGLVAALVSLGFASRLDRTAAILILLRAAWLLLATYVSVWVAANNADPLFAG